MKNFLKVLVNLIFIFSLTRAQYDYTCPTNYGCVCKSVSALCAKQKLTEIPKVPSSVQIYDLHNNFIKRIEKDTFKNLVKLKTLYLNNNNLTHLYEGSFNGLIQLEDLFLYNNNIEHIDHLTFYGLKNLKNLYLQKNKLKQIERGTFSNLDQLQRIFLGQNNLVRFYEDSIKSVSNLQILQLDGNKLKCDCDSFWLWDAVNPTEYSKRIYNFKLSAKCDSPSNLKNKNLVSLKKSDFKCEEPVIEEAPQIIEISLEDQPQEAKFECNSNGKPKPKIEWMKNNHKIFNDNKYYISNDGTVLIINYPDENDIGNYECIATNSIGEAKQLNKLKLGFKTENFEDIEFDLNDKDNENESFEEHQVVPETENIKNIYDNKLKFTRLPNDLELSEGSDTKLFCRSNDPNAKISWLKDGVLISQKYRFIINDEGDLEIKNVRVEDEGFYVCSIGNFDQAKYAQAYLTVIVPVTFLKRPQDLDATEGNSAEFQCSVSGKPSPIVLWKKDGQILKKSVNESSKISHYEFYNNNQLLRINNLKIEKDTGIYICIASNTINTMTSSARLNIQRAVPPQFRIMQQNVSVFEDHPISLECFAHGEPKPQVLWYKNGQRIPTDSRVYFDSYGYLSITQVRVSDSGEYLCRAENTAGFAVHNFHLSVKDIYGTIISNTVIKEALETAKDDVNRQFQNTLTGLNDKRRPKTTADLMALLRFPKDKTLSLVVSEEIYERALDIIFRYASNITFNITNKDQQFIAQEVLTHRQLQRISDLSGCSRHKRKVQCSQRCLKYRTFDGTCNNLEDPHKGAANTPLKRLLPANYQNGFSTPRGWNKSELYNGYMLPNAREVSTRIITTEKITNDRRFSHMLMQWGQFLDHDLDHTVMAMSLNRFSNGIACRDSCTNDQPCFPIEVTPNDTLRTHLPGKCMEFVRSSAVCGTGETSLVVNKIYQREQINQLTAFIDASNVYGSNDQDAFDIRERVVNTGKLKVHVTPKYPKGILPFNLDTNMDCQRDNTTTVGCFMAGDHRANEQLALLAMHNLWVRQHNFLADKLLKLNPNWSPEQVYQEARKIVGAQMQVITYDSWLPFILGPIGMKKLGKFEKYDPKINPTISNEFATAAFRFGHALIQPFTFRLNESFQEIPEGNLLLRDSFFAPQRYYYEGAMDPLIRGLYGVPAKLKTPREIMNSELTEKLFHIVRHVSQDLAALNIQRGRDHGLPGYTEYRRYCNLSDVNDFEDLKNEIASKQVREILRSLYGDVRNIDIWPAGMLEDVVSGSKLGPLFMCIIVEQMRSVRDGDRFWYENKGVFTENQLAEIKKTTLAKIICNNGDNIDYIQKDVFLNANFPNEMVHCSDLEDVSLDPWKNCCQDNARGLCHEPAYFYVPIEARFKSKSKR